MIMKSAQPPAYIYKTYCVNLVINLCFLSFRLLSRRRGGSPSLRHPACSTGQPRHPWPVRQRSRAERQLPPPVALSSSRRRCPTALAVTSFQVSTLRTLIHRSPSLLSDFSATTFLPLAALRLVQSPIRLQCHTCAADAFSSVSTTAAASSRASVASVHGFIVYLTSGCYYMCKCKHVPATIPWISVNGSKRKFKIFCEDSIKEALIKTIDSTPPADISIIHDRKAHFRVAMYQNLQLERLKHLAVVVDSREAKNTAKIKQLLYWLSTIGVKHVSLYDIDGLLKESFESCMDLRNENAGNSSDVSANTKSLHCSHRGMVIEYLSGSDGKEGIAKAAKLLCTTYFNGTTPGDNRSEPAFTEAGMAGALKAVGCGGLEPDLLLVYGPARCHLGFPAWRLRYTEIMHMGPLKSMKYGAIVKAFYDFSKKYQNYGK